MLDKIAPTLPIHRTYVQQLQDVYDAALKCRHTQCSNPRGDCFYDGYGTHTRDCEWFQTELALVLAIDAVSP